MENKKIELGKKIKEARKKAGLLQCELSKKTGISQTYISQLENGLVNPTFNILELICNAINVSISDIL